MRSPALGGAHPLIAIYRINLASVHLARNEPGAAEALLRQALPVRIRVPGVVPTRRRTFPEDDWSVGATKSLLGAALTALARYEEAEAVLLDAQRDLQAAPGPQGRDARTDDRPARRALRGMGTVRPGRGVPSRRSCTS